MVAKAGKPAPERRRQAKEKQEESAVVPLYPPALLTMSEAAIYTAMSLSLMKRLLWAGEIPSIVIGRRFRRVSRRALDSWVAEQESGGAA
jgi:excisionase family DNA binding protein